MSLNYHLLKRTSMSSCQGMKYFCREIAEYVGAEHYDKEMGPINHHNMGDKGCDALDIIFLQHFQKVHLTEVMNYLSEIKNKA